MKTTIKSIAEAILTQTSELPIEARLVGDDALLNTVLELRSLVREILAKDSDAPATDAVIAALGKVRLALNKMTAVLHKTRARWFLSQGLLYHDPEHLGEYPR